MRTPWSARSGRGFLSNYRVTFNLHEGRIELALPGEEVADGEEARYGGERTRR